MLRPYGSDVRWRIRQGDPESYRAAARAINTSNADVVNVQHEFGLYGTWTQPKFIAGRWTESAYDDCLVPFLEELRKPVVVTMHTVLPQPTPSIRATVRAIADHCDDLIVMASTAVDLLANDYELAKPPRVIPHGMPVIEPHGRLRFKDKLGVKGRTIISTFGLVDPRKGLQYMIEAMSRVIVEHPDALYLIAGQTHPDLLRAQGEEYRNSLVAQIRSLRLDDHVAFIDTYMTQRDIIELLLATDVYVTPYLDPNQITSGTLSYALGAGKAVVSTRYLHAAEALSDGRGVLVDFRDAGQLAHAVTAILGDPLAKKALEDAAFAYAHDATWPRSAQAFLGVMSEAATMQKPRGVSPAAVKHDMGRRSSENPILSAADVRPSLPGLEVISVFNAAAARIDEEVVLLIRVGERPIVGAIPPAGALTLDLTRPEPEVQPLGPGYGGDDVIGIAFLDTTHEPARVRGGVPPQGHAWSRPQRSACDSLSQSHRRLHGRGR